MFLPLIQRKKLFIACILHEHGYCSSKAKPPYIRRHPFTIILRREVEHPDVQPLRLKIDSGSKTTGLAAVSAATRDVVWTAELSHRGQAIKEAHEACRGVRRSRRSFKIVQLR